MKYLLKPDKIMNGIITKLLEETYLKSKLDKKHYITFATMKNIHEAIIAYDIEAKEIFGQISENICVPIDVRKHNSEECIRFFSTPGFILDDDVYAANGHFKYIYRAKGLRTIWFKDGTINEYSVYSTIDEYGMSLKYEEFDGIDLYDSEVDFQELNNGPCEKYNSPIFVLGKLLNINKAYDKAYYLEYLMNPPDVQILSEYSVELRKEIWNSILELGKEIIKNGRKEYELDLFKFCINFMNELNCGIEVEQIITFFVYVIENKSNVNENLVLDILNEINYKIDSNSKSDILEIKPNIWGIGLNLKEIYRRFKNR